MPRSAIGTGIVDLVLTPDKMPEALLNLARHPYVRQPAKAVEAAAPEEQLKALLTLVRAQTRRDFNSYRKRTLLRRIQRRMGLHQIDSLRDYTERLRNDPNEVRALAADLTINVTGFFRDPEAWQVLADKVIAPLVRERPTDSTIRAWVPGCSTGEEAYSIAMLVTEQAEAAGKSFDVKLFATDVTEGVLSSARAGHYPAQHRHRRRREAPGALLRDAGRHLPHQEDAAGDDHLRAAEPVAGPAVLAARPDQLPQPADLPRARLQKRVLALFHFALREGGHLFLGPAETIAGQEDLFQPVSKKWRIYRRLGPTRHDVVDFPLIGRAELGSGAETDAPTRTPSLALAPAS